MFSCELYEIPKNTFFTEHLRATASILCMNKVGGKPQKTITTGNFADKL